MEKLLTIVVPAYNSESTLERCLASLEYDWLEVIVVDDGSTDKTKEIAEKFAEKRGDVYRVISKKNGGHGSALNVGFKAAAGRYVGVIDSDDYASGRLNEMEAPLKSGADVLISDYYRLNVESGKLKNVRYDGQTPRVCTPASLRGRVTIHSMVVRREFVDFKLTEGCYYDDIQYVLYSLCRAVTFYYTGTAYYTYCIGRAEQSVSPENIFKKRRDYIKVLNDIIDWYSGSDKCNDNYIFDFITAAIVTNYNRYTSFIAKGESAREEIIAFDARLKEKNPALYRAAGKKSTLGYVNKLRKRNFTRVKFYAAAFNFIKKLKGY